MKISTRWLKDWVDTDQPAAAIADHLTLAGLEIEDIEPAAPPLDNVVVARIISAAPHPDADKLQLCLVDAGEAEPLQIVCGAPNAREGLNVVLARIGARLPGDFKIRKSKIRGVESFGMLCSGKELGLSTESEGITELPADAPIGTPLADYMGLDDDILDIALTPNRGDCLSVRGTARDLACLLHLPLKSPAELGNVSSTIDDTLAVTIDDSADCSAYAGRVIRGLDRSAPTPLWMRERLRRSGLRSINPLVDVTNYVMLELGQPMHAFDLTKLSGGVQVRRARQDEELTLLDEQSIVMRPDHLVIADDSGAIALAGAMGGLATAVDDATTDVFLESACFAPTAVAGTGRDFKLSSDSLHRFERGVDPALQQTALHRATRLLLDICGGQAGTVTLAGTAAPELPEILLRTERLNRLLGSELPDDAIIDILARLGCQIAGADGDGEYHITPPSHRYDLRIEADLVEEVARVHGYDNLPGRDQYVPIRLTAERAPEPASLARAALVQRGYHEAISFSFVDPKIAAAIDPQAAAIALDNPIASNLAQMRTELWSSLLPIWRHNVQRQQERIRLFELGRTYTQDDAGSITERPVVAGIASGLRDAEQWGTSRANVDFHDIKADLTALGAAFGAALTWTPGGHSALHPGRSATIVIDGSPAGYLGEMHPSVTRSLDLPGAPLLFELDYALLVQRRTVATAPLAEFPSSRRDLAVVVKDEVAVGDLLDCIAATATLPLAGTRVFDIYRGEGLPNGFKSVAFGLIFQDFSRTLSDSDIDGAMATLMDGLRTQFEATTRE